MSTADIPELRIEVLQPRDAGAAASLLLSINDNTTFAAEEAWLLECITRWPSLQLCAAEDGHLVGVASGALDLEVSGLGWSHDLAVSSSRQGHGVGAALIRAQLDAFRRLGCVRVRGQSRQSPTRLANAIAFFQRFGFRVVAETTAAGFPGIADGTRVFITECAL